MPTKAPKLRLTADEKKAITRGFNTIQRVLKKKNINIENVIGLVTSEQITSAARQVKVKFAEETAAQMNMIAFD